MWVQDDDTGEMLLFSLYILLVVVLVITLDKMKYEQIALV